MSSWTKRMIMMAAIFLVGGVLTMLVAYIYPEGSSERLLYSILGPIIIAFSFVFAFDHLK